MVLGKKELEKVTPPKDTDELRWASNRTLIEMRKIPYFEKFEEIVPSDEMTILLAHFTFKDKLKINIDNEKWIEFKGRRNLSILKEQLTKQMPLTTEYYFKQWINRSEF